MSQDRLKTFKNFGKDTDELRRRRTDQSLELRKARKDEQLTKRRNIDTDELDNTLSPAHETNGVQTAAAVSVNESTLKQIVMDMFCEDPDRQFSATQLTRKILSRERHPPIDIVIQAGIVPRCIVFLSNDQNPDLQFEAAWVLTNIASGNQAQTNTVVDAGAVGPFIEMLRSPYSHIAEQAIWALGNIAGDGPVLRDHVITKGIVPPLVALAKTQNSASFLRNVAWTLSNLCRAKSPPPPQDATKMCLPALGRLIKMTDMEVVSDACWALSYLSDGPNEKIEEVVKSGVVPRLVELLGCDNYNVITPCLRAVGNIVTGTDSQTQYVVKAGVLPLLTKLLKCPKSNIVKEAAWTVSNIAAGTIDQIADILAAGIAPLLVDVLRTGEFRAQKEAIWAITNITSGGSVDHMIHLCQNGAIPAMCDMLRCKDWRTIVTTLDGLENILKAAQEVNQVEKVACAIEESGGLDIIEQLQSHENNTVYTKAYVLIDNFFSDENAVDDELLPATNENGDFQMSVSNIPEGGFNL
ncbi:unnamed protein product [Orchesella dallaii]|uniref:Importin subunit alpha n=1 Tax=Orchesella dallaii TaxID=48710 RepID=A0ABP1Q5N0_9HEXA